MQPSDLSVYIHWPFCESKCPYCDFNSHVRQQFNYDDFVDCYILQLEKYAAELGARNIVSIYFGGGTPSLMKPVYVAKIIDKIASLWNLSIDAEITLEANPTSIEILKFQAFKDAGVNRVSIGIQSLNDDDLAFLGRSHSAKEGINALNIAAKIFDNYSFDLIYARPKQSLKSWQSELNQALKYAGNHLSLYQLTIEKGTKFYSRYKNSEFTIPNEDDALELYESTNDLMEKAGLGFYEISNYARVGSESKHNLTYWNYGKYIGIGAGAHSRIKDPKGARLGLIMIHNPDNWMQAVFNGNDAVQATENIDFSEAAKEMIIMGLRLRSGLSQVNFKAKTGYNFADFVSKEKLEELINGGFLEWESNNIRATKKGFPLLEGVISSLLG